LHMKVGAQLYTVREYMQNEKDMGRSLERVAKMGYTTVQVSGLGPIEPKKLRALCDANGLQIVITHTDPQKILADTQKVIEDHDVLGCGHIGIGSMPGKYRGEHWLPYFGEDFGPAAQKIAAAGKKLMYHNHHFEFMKYGGKTILELLVGMFPPEQLGVTFDTYWAQFAGADVRLWIQKLAGRLPVVHLKDMQIRERMGSYDPYMAGIGAGTMDFASICEAFEAAGTEHMMVEVDTCDGSPFDVLASSYAHLQSLGYR